MLDGLDYYDRPPITWAGAFYKLGRLFLVLVAYLTTLVVVVFTVAAIVGMQM